MNILIRQVLFASVFAGLATVAVADTIWLASQPDQPLRDVMVIGIGRQPDGAVQAVLLPTQETLKALTQAGIRYERAGMNNLIWVFGVQRVEFSTLSETSAGRVSRFFDEANVRSKVSRVRADMRAMATALEAYFIDNNAYPAWVLGSSPESISFGNPLLAEMPTFRCGISAAPGMRAVPMTLTTPIAYVTSYFSDPFNTHQASVNTFSYYSEGKGWILVSPGPDRVFSLDPREVYSGTVPQPSPELLLYAYDPTNGTVSAGDIFRVKY